MPGQHATLSPSGASRWLSCPASVRMSSKVPPEPDSPYAAEGTKAHALAEIRARRHFGKTTAEQEAVEYEAWRLAAHLDIDTLGEMEENAHSYIELLESRMAEMHQSAIFFEQRMPSGIESCWGTSDAVIVSPTHIEIWDLKYGAGVAVSAVDNPQLRLYALGALDTFGDVIGETEYVTMGVFQPRVFSNGTNYETNYETMSASDLREWRESVRPVAAEALGPDARFGPSEEACRWCPAAGICTTRAITLAGEDFAMEFTEDDPEVLSSEQLAELLPRLSELRSWVEAVSKAALDRAYSKGEDIPGFKVVMSRGVRRVTHEAEAVALLAEATGRGEDEFYTRKIKGVGDLEKALKALPKVRNESTGRLRAQTLDDVIPEYVTRTPGAPALVPEDDKRPSIDPNSEAAKEFSR